MKKIALLLMILSLIMFTSLAHEEYGFLNLKGEIIESNSKLVKISWKNSEQLLNDIKDGKIKEVMVEFDVKLDQGNHLSEKEIETFKVNADENSYEFNPFVGRNELNTDNTLVSIRLRYTYIKEGKRFNTEYIEPIVLGHDSYVKNASYWSKKELNVAINMGLILQSFKDDVSRPINRYEFIKMLMRLNKYIGITKSDGNLKFEDESDSDINLAYNLGYIKGINGNLFAGENNLTREELATILSRYMRINEIKSEVKSSYVINDLDLVSTWAKESVIHMLESGIIKGDNNNNVNPKKNITCEEAIVMVVRIFNLKNR